jgi:Protein of unknown function (DUF1573)
MSLLRCLTLVPLLALSGANLFALEWRQTVIEAKTEPFQQILSIVFDFKNAGGKPVVIQEIQTSCHCLSATSNKQVYAPGETGQLTAKFTIGDRNGVYERQITVIADDSSSPQRLTVKIDVPDIATATPRSREWAIGSPASEQTVEIRAADKLYLEFSEAVSTSTLFQTRLEVVEAGHLYKLHLKPISTATGTSAAIRLHGHDRAGHNVLVNAYVLIR